jgi:3'-phosphoadenosine 5'-phosphosulfate sulfotransferase (PAPS reductase)/FAD synthetase
MRERVIEAKAILDGAIRQHQPAYVFALLSGGYDSLATTWLASQHPMFSGVVHIDTGTGVPETRKFVRRVCRYYDWPLFVVQAAEDYEALVLRDGFPGPAMHRVMYRRLKDRGIDWVQREFTRPRGVPIMYVAGARLQESVRRMGNAQEVRVHKAQRWVNPLLHWSAYDVRAFCAEHNLPRNPVKDHLEMSGECLCGAYAKKGELALIEAFYPWTGKRLRRLEAKTREAGFPWGWDEQPPAWFTEVKRGQLMHEAFAPLCSSCDWRQHAPGNEAA